MAKIFYDHLVLIEEIIAEIDAHDLDPKKRQELIALVDQTLHHHILDVILTHLPHHHHETFLTRFRQAPHDLQLLAFLKERVDTDIEGAIYKKAQAVKRDLISTIRKSRKKASK